MPIDFDNLLGRATRVRGVLGAVVLDAEDGLVVAQSIMEGVRVEAVAALTASLYRRLVRACEAAGTGEPAFVQMQGSDGVLVTMPGENGLILAVVGEPNMNIGLVRLELMRMLGR